MQLKICAVTKERWADLEILFGKLAPAMAAGACIGRPDQTRFPIFVCAPTD
jgi:hypothetical protein